MSGPSGGNIEIVVSRSNLWAAPDSARFSVNLSNSLFDTPAPAPGEFYDARLHDLVFLWDFGEDRSWTAPEKVLPEWRNARTARGPWVSHVYKNPGQYTVRLTVIEPSSGKVAQAPDATVTVGDPGVIYSGGNTICINPAGDGDFSDAPAGAVHLSQDALYSTDSVWTSMQGGAPKRWLFKRGGSYTVGLGFDSGESAHPYFGAYGTGDAPVLSPPTDGTNDNRAFQLSPKYQGRGGALVPDFRLSGLRFQGNFDPRSETPATAENKTANVLRTDKYLDLVIHDCEMRGMRFSTVGVYSDTNAPVPMNAHSHIDDCVISDMGGQYPAYWGPARGSEASVSITGTRIAQNPDAADFGAETRAPVRINHVARTHIRGSDFFGYDSSNAGLKLLNTPVVDGALVNAHSFSVEGTLFALQIQGNVSEGIGRSSVQNVIIDGAVVVGYYSTRILAQSYASGVTLRNLLLLQPNTPKSGNALVAGITFSAHGTLTDAVQTAPCRAYNCTLVMDRPLSDNNNIAPLAYEIAPELNFAQHNNVLVGGWAELTGDLSPDGPLAQDVLWAPRNIGRSEPPEFIRDTAAATPADAVRSYGPTETSGALGDALTDPSAHTDITGADRPAYPSRGAWEMPDT
ncbi:MAG: PKD domain-containing protein [Pseudomonadota bacterium]